MSDQYIDYVESTLKPIRIGCASAFWGDTSTAAKQLVDGGELDYLVFDYLAEVTMSIMAGQQMKKPEAGYARDFISVIAPLLPQIKAQGIKVISNAGGVNLPAAQQAMQAAADAAGIDVKIGIVEGDNLSSRQKEFADLKEMYTGADMPSWLLSFNAYLGAFPIAQALANEADIVITGRCVDSAVTLAPMIHEFGWRPNDYDKLSAGSLAGHLIECGAQCTGGNFTDWREVADGYDNMGFPIVVAEANGDFVVTKPTDTGGAVTPFTVGEQLVYEIGDPSNYLLPDVTANFSQVSLKQVGDNKVKVTGATGSAPTDTYKASATYPAGHRMQAILLLGGAEAKPKAEAVAEAVLSKVRRLFTEQGFADFDDVQIDALGAEALWGENAAANETREVVLKLFVRHSDQKALGFFGKEIAQAATGMAPGITGFFGRPSISPVIELFSCLVPKNAVPVTVTVGDESEPSTVHIAASFTGNPQPDSDAIASDGEHSVPLIKLAVCRSGDKGDSANIGVIARKPEYLPYIRAAVTPETVAERFKHLLSDAAEVHRFEMPGINGLNFLLSNALGGGGMASLRADPQGKCYGQILLDMPVSVPDGLLG